MAAPQRDTTIESALPVASSNGLNTLQNINFNSGSNTCDLPASTTLNGLAISAQGNISGSNTTGATFSITNSGVYTGVGSFQNIGDSATTGVVALMTGNGLTTGTVLSLTSTGTIVTTGEVLNIAANSATTSTGLARISGTSLTDGFGLEITSGGASLTATGGGINVLMGAATLGNGIKVSTTGVYTGTTGIISATANSATTGSIVVINGTGITSGKGLVINGTSATLTTGFYIACNDATGNVFTVGSNGHLTANLGGGTAPVMTTNATGISATVITAGSTDVCGTFTTTGTPASGTVLTCTFHKTYTVAPKFVIVAPANAAAGGVNTMPIITQTATTFVLTWPAGGVYAATPSFTYFVMA
jgi:hypothetical protein